MEARQKSIPHIPDYSLSNVLFQAIQGLNTVDRYLEEAEKREDANAVRWLEETKSYYQQILGSAQEFVQGRGQNSLR